MPPEFADLQEFADVYGISDDVERGEATDHVAAGEKQRFVATLKLRFEQINRFLDLHAKEDDESVHMLGRVAEAACEVMLDLERQSKGGTR